jgi:hypothetical protein
MNVRNLKPFISKLHNSRVSGGFLCLELRTTYLVEVPRHFAFFAYQLEANKVQEQML